MGDRGGRDLTGRQGAHALQATAPFAIMAAVAVAAVWIRRPAGTLPLLSLGPALGQLVGELVYSVITGGIALVACVALAAYRHLVAAMPGRLAVATVAGVSVAGIAAAARARRRARQAADLAAIADVTQGVLLHPVPQQAGQVRLAARYMSAATGARVGGDLYETVVTAAGLRFIIGDVQGKGLPAVQTAAVVLSAFRENAYDAPGLTAIADRIETSLTRQTNSSQFVTAVLGQVSGDGSRIELLNRGHPPPLLASGPAVRFVEPEEPALPLGLADVARLPGRSATLPLRPDDCLLFYTDGVSEARNKFGEYFPIIRFLPQAGLTRPAPRAEPAAVLARLSDEVLHHVGHALEDDAAMLIISRV